VSSTGLYIGPVSGNVNGSSITGLIKEFELRELDTWLLPPPSSTLKVAFLSVYLVLGRQMRIPSRSREEPQ
jgi:hypothetical protein